MAHPMSPNRKRCSMQGVWLILQWQAGQWHVRLDLKPGLIEHVAKRFAEQQTKMSGNKHRAVEFAAK